MAHPVGKVKTPISATPGNRASRSSRQARGFTLVELLVVFAIGALLTVLVPVAFGTLRESAQYRQTLRSILTDMRTARIRAVSEGTEIRFKVDLAQRIYGIDGRPMHELPRPLELKATVASIEMAADDVAAIRFLPTGGATGGSIDVVRPSGAGVRLSVDWLSGQVSQGPLAP
jgi:general secretion pathway protein H